MTPKMDYSSFGDH